VTEATQRQSIASAGFSVAGDPNRLFETATFLHSFVSHFSPQLETEHRFLFPVFLQTVPWQLRRRSESNRAWLLVGVASNRGFRKWVSQRTPPCRYSEFEQFVRVRAALLGLVGSWLTELLVFCNRFVKLMRRFVLLAALPFVCARPRPKPTFW
jgi:hypothetical protein